MCVFIKFVDLHDLSGRSFIIFYILFSEKYLPSIYRTFIDLTNGPGIISFAKSRMYCVYFFYQQYEEGKKMQTKIDYKKRKERKKKISDENSIIHTN